VFGAVDALPNGHGAHRTSPRTAQRARRSSLTANEVSLQEQGYQIQSAGWSEDAFGKLSYIPHGTIEEVNDDAHDIQDNDHEMNPTHEDNDNDAHANDDTTGNFPNLRPTSSLSSLGAIGDRRNTFGIPVTSSPLPASCTPPPPPRLLNQSLFFSPSSPAPGSLPAGTNTAQPRAPPALRDAMQTVLDQATEITLLQDNMSLLASAETDLKHMHTWFYAQRPHETFTDHIDCCAVIQESIQSIRESLNNRKRLGEEEWGVKSPKWHERYAERLYSLQRTLQRLLSVRATIERRKLKPHHVTLVLEKLLQHHLKLSDLAHKFKASFERLQLRHLHWLLEQAHNEATRKGEALRASHSHADNDRQWLEDTAMLSDLRRQFEICDAQYHRTKQKRLADEPP